MTCQEYDKLLKLSYRFSLRRKKGSPVTYITGIDWGNRPNYIFIKGKKPLTIW